MSFGSKQPVLVLCSSEESRQRWQSRSSLYDDIALETIYPSSQAWRIVKNLITLYDRPLVVCQESVWFGAEFGRTVGLLTEELNANVPRWGACGNRGSTWEGSAIYDYTRYAQTCGKVRTGANLRPVLTLDDNLVLLNSVALREFELCDLGGLTSPIFGVPLSLECLRHGLPLLVSPHLFTLRLTQHSPAAVKAFSGSTEFMAYCREHFINHSVPWPDAAIDMQDSVDYDYVAHPEGTVRQSDTLALFDGILLALRKRSPSLTLCCRTQFTRPELLHRAVTSFAVARSETNELLDLRVCVVTDRDTSVSEPYIRRFRDEFPALGIDCWSHSVRGQRYSRADLLIAGIERATTDYIWFVDDDDYVLPGAIEALSRTLEPDEPVITIGNSIQVQEKWSVPESGSAYTQKIFEMNRTTGRFYARNIFRVFTGENFTPICSMLLPVGLTKERLKDRHALGDYNEDYFILLAALTAPQVEVRVLDVDICGVSFRDTENTVAQTDRSKWDFSYATFMHEILSAGDRNPLLWQLGNSSQE